MLKNSVLNFYQGGQVRKAGEIYSELRKTYPRDEFKDDMLTWLRKRILDEIEGIKIKDATELIIMALREAYFRFAVHDDDEAYGREKWAEEVFTIYQVKYSDEEWRRLDLPNFEMLRFLAFLDFLRDPFYPEHLRSALLGRIKVERPDLFEKLEKQKDLFIQKSQAPAQTQ
jgi:hypothetical protein